MTAAGPLALQRLGLVPYADGLTLQRRLVAARRAGTIADTLLLVEHPPVITIGRRGRADHVLAPPDELARLGVQCCWTDRGGEVTYHAPGQLVGYPVLALPDGRRDAHRYLRDLEEALILTAGELGVRAGRRADLTGVWVGPAKLAAIGVRLSTGWITSHGFALNVNTDLAGFARIVPCGQRAARVTSLARELDRALDLDLVGDCVARHLAAVLGLHLEAA